ncbi:Serine protease snake [Orchesella cincta]|uniref:Serine protease snake n=1 Tax=Orchesella cincta TaxID=48709 RepID=A0A1D2N755_ORCCI|nr:Serine protease snake [Orchesella cincta]
MKTNRRLVTIALWINCILIQLNTATSQLFVGRSCSTGGFAIVRGDCRRLTDCPAALSNLRAGIFPTLCYHEDDQPIICCPTKRVSAIKCDEYTKQVVALFGTSDIQPFYVGGYVDPSRIPGGGIRSAHCNNTKQALITGGRDADIDEMSFTVAIGYEDSGREISWKCGGTLISDQYILTAAHCLDGKASKPPTRVLLGDKRLQKLDTFSGARRVEANVQDIFVHPDYKRPLKYHDIGLIKLDKKVKFSRSVQPACLPRPEYRPETTSEFFTSGWGRLDSGKRSEMLQVVNLNRYSLKDCSKVFVEDSDGASSELPEGIIKSQICAGDKDGDKDSCDGDSGGPLTAKREKSDCIQYLLGVTSFGSKFCGYGSPGVYTNVQSYLNWIESIVWSDYDI